MTTGALRIYLGAAPGVGKTVAMLEEGRRRRQSGADAVVGFVETHDRARTSTRMEGLEVVPRQQVDYRGVLLDEMDLEAVLRRRPEVVLIDELAHTNVPGSGRHDKRWQDVLEILDSGIDVVTTLNVQHLESLADAIEIVTDVPVRERVPDWVVRQADEIELVDLPPDGLRQRLRHGDVYPMDAVPQALGNFFRADHLATLRQLAHRLVAGDDEEALLSLLSRHPSRPNAEQKQISAEQIMVAVTLAPGTDTIVRRAADIASRVAGDLHVVHVTAGHAPRQSDLDRLELLRELTAAVGASWHDLDADDPVGALVNFAQHHAITQVVIGSSKRSRWQEVIGGGSIVNRIVHQATAADIDVHVIARRVIARRHE